MKMDSTSRVHHFSDDQFLRMISAMMYTFGDVKEPLEESVQVVYIILREQMDTLLQEAESAAKLRRSPYVSHEDILFLLRKNKAKLKHLLQYLEVLDLKPKLLLDVKLSGDHVLLRETKKTAVNMCMEYLARIEDCEEFTSILKDGSVALPKYAMKRLERRNMMIERMTPNEYKEFTETLQVSFCPVHNPMEFKNWLFKDRVKKFNLTPLAVTIIGFLVREVIAEIVEMALVIKSRKWKIQRCLNYPVELSSTSRNNMIRKDFIKDLDHSINISKNEIDGIAAKRQNGMKSLNISNKQQIITLGDTPNKKYNDNCKDLSMDVSEIKNMQKCSRSIDDVTKIQPNSLEDEVTNMDVSPHQESKILFGEPSSCSTNCSNDSDGSTYVVIESSSGSVNEDSHSQDIANTDSAATEWTKHMDLDSLRSSFSDVTETDLKVCLLQHKEELTRETNSKESPAIEDISDIKKETSKTHLKIPQETFDAPNLLETVMKEPIKPIEIREAYVRFYEPSPLPYFFANFPVRRKKKLYLGVSDDDI